ncbi:MAG: F0F1 ATP synthase subunit epsilon [Proteobacteria bacterium]|nr:F0F1 ATP synthase subunit epsilon [Pseudomonadota bacterium]MBU1711289.1 F0F1 ATP synthase subunit epsilon [Pseudomonadota bacterium]
MILRILLPTAKFLEEKVAKIKGEGLEGEFCLKPRHIDYSTALSPGIFSYITANGKEHFLAIDQGILVKQGDEVMIATRSTVAGELGQLNREVENMLIEKQEREKQGRSAVAKLEIGFIKRFLEFSHRS